MTPEPVSEPAKTRPDPDLDRPAPTKLLAIDWSKVSVATEADAHSLWDRIAPTGEDWEAKLEELPDDGPIASKLALALLRYGNFTCVKPQQLYNCVRPPQDVEPPRADATLGDPCLRRMLALWAMAALDESDVDAARDALRAIVKIPAPESQLIASAFEVLPEGDQDGHLELRAIAYKAGHREIANNRLPDFDAQHLIEAVQKHKIDGALDLLPVEQHRGVYLAAIADEQLHGAARVQAMIELVGTEDKLSKDGRKALIAATKSKDCTVAAAAARQLVKRGEKTFAPARPRARQPAAMMRAMCVLASYEQLQDADEASYLLGYVPTRGLELVTVKYDAYSSHDDDGDGDVHTIRTLTTVRRDEVILPELEDMIRAFGSCTGTVCKSDEREFRFGFKPGSGGELMLARLEVVDRPPCPDPVP